MMSLRPLVALALSTLLAGVLFLAPGHASEEPLAPISIVLVRHAETAASTQTQRDPELSERGSERAVALRELLSGAGVTHLFSSEYSRTQATLAPLARANTLEVVPIAAGDASRQVEALRSLPPGAVAVVAGHSNTVPALVAALGGEARGLEQHERYGAMLGHDQYDRAFVVTLPSGDGAVATLELRYGD